MKKIAFPLLITSFLYLASCSNSENKEAAKMPTTKEDLGKLLFFDPILSQTNKISCASCHIESHAFADTTAVSLGVNGKHGTRNTPSAMNQSARTIFFWDGRAESLEKQALGPIENPVEMNLPIGEAIRKLNEDPTYLSYFKNVFHESANKDNIALAIASFERTLETSDTPFDKFMHDDSTAISESAKRGQKIFNVKGKCFDCHFGPDFTADQFKNIGLYNGKELNDKGRYETTKDTTDLGKFKVPGLRNVAITAPYMHNGMFKTLREVIDYYDTPTQYVKGSVNTDTLLLQPLHLSEQEKNDLLAFLNTLTDERFKIK